MKDADKTKEQLVAELVELRRRTAGLLDSEKRRAQSEEDLRESRRTLSTLMGNLPGMAYRCRNDQDWTMEFVSEGCLALTGYQPSDLIKNRNISYAQLIHPEDRDKVWSEVQQALKKDEPFHLTYRLLSSFGDEKWVWEQGVGIFLDNVLVALEGFITDVTERVRTEEALKESEQNYRTLVESSSDAILLLDKGRRIVSCNPAFLDLFGFEPNKDLLKGKSIRIVHPSEQSFLSFGEKALPVIREKGFFRTEWELMRKDGSLFPIEGTLSPIKNGDGSIQGYVAIIRDITQRKRAENELKKHRDHLEELVRQRSDDLIESEEKYRTLVENVPLVIYRMKPDGKVLLINHFAEHVFGYSPTEIFRNPGLLSERVHDEDRERVKAFREKIFSEGEESIAEYRVTRKDDHIAYVMDHAIPFKREDGSIRVVDGMMMDMTDRVEMQKKLLHTKEIETIGEVSLMLAHEIRNPLVSVGGFARRLLLSMSPDDPNREKGEIIMKEVGRLEKILRMILHYIQPLELHLSPIDPNRLVESALSKVRKEMEERNVRADIKLASDLPAIYLDPVQMERVLVTLMRTALSQTSQGAVISVRTLVEDGFFELVMTYPALHLSHDDVKRFFYPFTSSPLDHDIGYLPMSKIMVDKYGGNINVILEEPGILRIQMSLPISGISPLSPKSEEPGTCHDLGGVGP